MKPIFYHHDYYRQMEFVTDENYFATDRTINESGFEEGSIYGFENIVVRPEQPIRLIDKKIKLEHLRTILDTLSLTFSNNVFTGYANSSEKVTDTIVWGFEQYESLYNLTKT